MLFIYILSKLPSVLSSSIKYIQQRMRWEIRPAVVWNDKTANKEWEMMTSSEKGEGLLHKKLIWPNHHSVAVTIYSIHFQISSVIRLQALVSKYNKYSHVNGEYVEMWLYQIQLQCSRHIKVRIKFLTSGYVTLFCKTILYTMHYAYIKGFPYEPSVERHVCHTDPSNTYYHHHHHVQEELGLIPVPCILKMKLVPPSLPQSSYVSSSFGLYCSACLGILFVSILCMCCSHFSWYCFISFTIFCAPVFFPNTLVFFFILVLLFQEGVLKISSVLLLNLVPLFSSMPRLHFRISTLL